jgi:hypothetical protein
MASKKKSKIRITKPLWGKFNLPYPAGSDVSLESKMATELVNEGFAIPAAEAAKADKTQAEEKKADQETEK